MDFMDVINTETMTVRVILTILVALCTAIIGRIFYMQRLHPLSKFPGPWYATSFSIVGAMISLKQREPEFFMYLLRKYGSKYAQPPS
jgi:hypothetical protein